MMFVFVDIGFIPGIVESPNSWESLKCADLCRRELSSALAGDTALVIWRPVLPFYAGAS